MNHAFPVQRPGLTALFFLILSSSSPWLSAATISIAVTSDFDVTLDSLRQQFEAVSEHRITVKPGDSREHYSQIMSGADIDILLADDDRRPLALEQAGKTIEGSRFTYARQRLALWGLGGRTLSQQILENHEFQTLAITNPRLSRTGQASRTALENLSAWDGLENKLILGSNPGQTYQFVIGGDVELALITYNQIIYGRFMQAGNFWLLPDGLYPDLPMEAVQLKQSEAAAEFMAFLKSDFGQAIIRRNGYHSP